MPRSSSCLSAVVPGANSIELPTRFVYNVHQSEICLWFGTLAILLYFYDSGDTAVVTQLWEVSSKALLNLTTFTPLSSTSKD